MSNDQNPSPAAGIGPARGVTIIGETMRIQGTMTRREEVQLNGHWEGQMEVDSRLTIGAGGKANANIRAGEVIVAGSAKGNVEPSGASCFARAPALKAMSRPPESRSRTARISGAESISLGRRRPNAGPAFSGATRHKHKDPDLRDTSKVAEPDGFAAVNDGTIHYTSGKRTAQLI